MTLLLISDIELILDVSSCYLEYVQDLVLLESIQRLWTKQVYNMSYLSYADKNSQLLFLFPVKGKLLHADILQCFKIFHSPSP